MCVCVCVCVCVYGQSGGGGGLQNKRKPENRFDVLNNSHVKYLASVIS